MNPVRNLRGLLAFCLVAFGAQSAYADFKVCNKRASTMWVAHAMFVRTTEVMSPCSSGKLFGGCYFTAWEVAGWKQAGPNQCVTAWVGNVPSRFVYVRAQFADGAVLSGPVSFTVQHQAGFKWHEDITSHGDNCTGSHRSFDPCSSQPVQTLFREIDTGNATNFTLNIN